MIPNPNSSCGFMHFDSWCFAFEIFAKEDRQRCARIRVWGPPSSGISAPIPLSIMPRSTYMTHPEKIPVQVFPEAQDASRAVAHEIARLIREKAALGHKTVLGLATGSTPIGVYAELVRLHQTEK